MTREFEQNIEEVLNQFVRPALIDHMGNLEITDFDEEDGTLWIMMTGQCAGCPSADSTVENLVAKELMSRFPEIKQVEIDDGITDEIYQEAMKLFTHRSEKK